jgi:hypothetical protein
VGVAGGFVVGRPQLGGARLWEGGVAHTSARLFPDSGKREAMQDTELGPSHTPRTHIIWWPFLVSFLRTARTQLVSICSTLPLSDDTARGGSEDCKLTHGARDGGRVSLGHVYMRHGVSAILSG